MPLSSRIIKAQNVQLVAKDCSDRSQWRQPEEGRQNNCISGAAVISPDHNGREKGDEKQGRAIKLAHDQGLAAGIAWQKEQGLMPLKAFSQLVVEVGDLKKKLLADAEEQMLRLIVAVAEKVIHAEVSTSSQVILGILREAVKGVVDREGMKIRLNPQDFLFIMGIKADFLKEFDGMKNVAFEEDEDIQRGGALLETVGGEVDARLEQRLMEVRGALKAR